MQPSLSTELLVDQGLEKSNRGDGGLGMHPFSSTKDSKSSMKEMKIQGRIHLRRPSY